MGSPRIRQTYLFNLLLLETTFKPASCFSQKLGITNKTLYSDIMVLNAECSNYDLNIVKRPRKGILLEGSSENKQKFLASRAHESDSEQLSHPTYRQMYILCKTLFDGQDVKLSDLESKFFISQMALRQDMDNINKIFKKYGVKINSEKTIIKIAGKEENIQKAIVNFISANFKQYFAIDIYNPSLFKNEWIETLFDIEIIDLTIENVRHILNSNKRKISAHYMQSIFIIILILAHRLKNKHHIKSYNDMHHEFSKIGPYFIALDIAESFEKNLGISFDEKDTYYLTEQMYAHGITPIVKSAESLKQYEETVDRMLKKMSKFVDKDFISDMELRDVLLAHIPPMIYRLKRSIRIENPFLEQIKKEYIVLFSLTWYVAIDIEQNYHVVLDENEISFLFIYFQVSLEKRFGSFLKKILFVYPEGLSTYELLFERIRQIIPNKESIVSVTKNDIQSINMNAIDFVISVEPINNINAPIIYISPMITEEEEKKIVAMCLDLKKNTKTFKDNGKSMIGDANKWFSKDMIFVKGSFASKSDCLDFLVDQYVEKNLVTDEFRNSIYEREIMGNTSLHTGVAVPHALPVTVKKTKFAIMLLDEPIYWGSGMVKMVIVLGMAEKDTDKLCKVLSYLYKKLEMADWVDEMLTIQNKQLLLDRFIEIFQN